MNCEEQKQKSQGHLETYKNSARDRQTVRWEHKQTPHDVREQRVEVSAQHAMPRALKSVDILILRNLQANVLHVPSCCSTPR